MGGTMIKKNDQNNTRFINMLNPFKERDYSNFDFDVNFIHVYLLHRV